MLYIENPISCFTIKDGHKAVVPLKKIQESQLFSQRLILFMSSTADLNVS